MDNWVKHMIFIMIFLFMIIFLALSYDSFKDCVEPIHHWYMGFICFGLIHRILLMWSENINPSGILWVVLMVFIVPISLIFIFLWNIVGAIYLAMITQSDSCDDCMNQSSLIFDWVLVIMIFLFYISFFISFLIILRQIQNKKEKENEVKTRLRKIYNDVLISDSILTKKGIYEIRNNIDVLQFNYQEIIEKMGILPEEEQVIRLFYIPEVRKTPSSISKIKDSLMLDTDDTLNMDQSDQNKSGNLTEPLLDMMRKKHKEDILEKTQSYIQQNADEDAEECIICFDPFEDLLTKVVLKCNHKFHENCLFSWFQKKMTCPMCRRNIRLDLLSLLKDHLKEMESDIEEPHRESFASNLFLDQ